MDGILIIDKPAGWTSHDVVAKMRKILKTKRIGHTGTLDPFATGVLVLLVGRATRLAQFLDKDRKEYEAIVRFGFETDTGDFTGKRKEIENIEEAEKINFTSPQIEEVLESFRGEIEQTPPMYSAKKIEGKKLYELARKGLEIERKPVKVAIYELEISARNDIETFERETNEASFENNNLRLRIVCSAGTYIRTLAEDIGRKLGVGAHLVALRRTGAGKFKIENASDLETLENYALNDKLNEILISMNDALAHLPQMNLNAAEVEKTRRGMRLEAEDETLEHDKPVRMIDENANLVAVGFYDETESRVQPRVVMN